MDQYHGLLELFYGIGTFILGGALAWAILHNRYRNRLNDQIGDAATREEYRHPDSYNPDSFRAGLKR